MVNLNTSECVQCHKRYKVLTQESLCYFCHLYKYHEPPKTGAYKIDKIKD